MTAKKRKFVARKETEECAAEKTSTAIVLSYVVNRDESALRPAYDLYS